ncbi:MAG: hypothetical protein Q7S20_07340 [Gemmatimonadaceae bacterium]|nr:hypothetical protein [Gemmatimonadaceae bacterium]
MSSLDTGFVTRQMVTEPQRAFARALGLIMSGQPDEAAMALDSVRVAYTEDTLVHTASRVLLTAMLQYQDKWKEMAELNREGRHEAAVNDKADVESWASAFKSVPAREVAFPGTPVVLPLILSASGTPMIPVTINGKEQVFNLDTGAQETYSTDGLLMKTKVRTFVGERRLIGGFAGLSIVHGRFVDELHLTMAGQPLLFRKLLVFAPAFSSFVSLDGILGSDVGKGGAIRIDATNGLFLLEGRNDEGLRIKS